MAIYGRRGKQWARYNIAQNIMIWSQNAPPYLTTVCCYLDCIYQ